MMKIVRASLYRRSILISLSFRLSAHLSVLLSPWSNLADISLRVSLDKGCALTLDDVCRSRVRVISDQAKFLFSENIHFPLSLDKGL